MRFSPNATEEKSSHSDFPRRQPLCDASDFSHFLLEVHCDFDSTSLKGSFMTFFPYSFAKRFHPQLSRRRKGELSLSLITKFGRNVSAISLDEKNPQTEQEETHSNEMLYKKKKKKEK